MQHKDLSEYLKNHIVVTQDGVKNILPLNKINFLNSKGNYTSIHLVDDKTYVISKNLGTVYKQHFKKYPFYRINQSYIINFEQIKSFTTKKITLKNGVVITKPITRITPKKILFEKINQNT